VTRGWGRVSQKQTSIGLEAPDRRERFAMHVRSRFGGWQREGLGVGLAMVRHIVAGHGGMIHGGMVKVASEPRQGSTFTALLPATERS